MSAIGWCGLIFTFFFVTSVTSHPFVLPGSQDSVTGQQNIMTTCGFPFGESVDSSPGKKGMEASCYVSSGSGN